MPRRLATLPAAALILALAPVAVATTNGYHRQPALHGDTVVFVAEGDLWKASASGGVAHRLTSHPGLESHPTISPDGRTVAFAATYEGPTEVYTMPLGGGLPVRRTFDGFGSDRRVHPVGWAPDGDLLYTTRTHSRLPDNQLVRLDLATDRAELLPLSQAADGCYTDDGRTLVFTRLPFQGSHTKRYRGGTAEQLWRYGEGDPEAAPLTTDFAGRDRDPAIWNGRVVFASERDETMNLWSMTLDGSDLRQHTRHAGWDVRHPSLSGGRVAYQLGAGLRLLDLATGADRPIPLRLESDLDQTREHWIDEPVDYLTSARLGPEGRRVALTARGEVFVAPVGPGRLARLDRASDVRYRQARFLPDGERVLAFSDEDGELELWTLPGDGVGDRRQVTDGSTVMLWRAEVSPDGRRVAFTDRDYRLFVQELSAGRPHLVARSEDWLVEELEWSADGRYLAFTLPWKAFAHHRVGLFDTVRKTTTWATSERYDCWSPAFSPDGRWLYFLSDREFESLVRSPWGPRQPEPFFDRPTLLFALALREGERFPFLPADELTPHADPTAGNEDAEESDDAPPRVRVDAEGLEGRLWRLPVEAGNYSRLLATQSHLFYTSLPDRHEGKTHLMAVGVGDAEPEPVRVVEDVSLVDLSLDRKRLLVRVGDALHVVDADGSERELDDDTRVDLSKWRFSLDPREEWRQMFVEAWRLMRDHFYDRDMHGLDWDAMLAKYEPLVDRVTDRHELSDLLAQLVSELSALHHFVYGGDRRRGPDAIHPGDLGAVLVLDEAAGGHRIVHVFESDPEEPERRSPLARPDLDVSEGDVVVHVNGTPTRGVPRIRALLRGQAGQQVLLGVRRAGRGPVREVVVVPIEPGEAADLRYHEWELTRRRRVEELSGGRIGYVHLRAMGARDMGDWVRHYPAVFDKDGLIVDVRHNGGGNIDSWILSRLLRKAWFYWSPRVGAPSWNMQQAFRGHAACLVDEKTGSDGEAFAEGFRRLGIGELIGMRSWGGEIWLTSSNVLVDGGIATAAEFGVYGPEGAWLIEGHGVEPDVVVDNLPRETFEGRDTQLETAVARLLAKIAAEPIIVPPPPPGKDLSFPARR